MEQSREAIYAEGLIETCAKQRSHLLDLTGLGLEVLPDAVCDLPMLRDLVLTGNKLTTLPDRIGDLTNLRSLYLLGNPLRSLPASFGGLSPSLHLVLFEKVEGSTRHPTLPDWLTGLYLAGNSSLFPYLRSLVDARPFREAKVLLVGDGAAGKTSCLHRLLTGNFIERDSTHSIEVRRLNLTSSGGKDSPDITLHCWDFGGQDVYRVTHQFFYSSNAIYLLVWNPREMNRRVGLEDWIEQIALRVGSRARVLLVATHADVDRLGFRLDYGRLQNRFEAILIGHVEIDSKRGMASRR